MTSATAAARATPLETPRGGARRPPLRLVATRPLTAGRLPFVLLVGGVLATGLMTLLLLHTLAAQDAFRLHDLRVNSAALADTEQQLAVAVQQAQSPAGLAARARGLGMVPAGSVAFIRLHDGRVVGVAHAALPPPPPPSPAPSTSPSPAASGKASASPAPSTAASERASSSPTAAHPRSRHRGR